MYVTVSLSFYSAYDSLLYFILDSPLSFVGPKIALKIFLPETPKITWSDFDNTHVSEPYASTGVIKVLYNFILFFMDENWDLNCLFNPQKPLLAIKILFLISAELSLLTFIREPKYVKLCTASKLLFIIWK